MIKRIKYAIFGIALCLGLGTLCLRTTTSHAAGTLSAPFTRKILQPRPEAPFKLRFFTTAVKSDSRGRIITGFTDDPVKNVVGQEAAGSRNAHQPEQPRC